LKPDGIAGETDAKENRPMTSKILIAAFAIALTPAVVAAQQGGMMGGDRGGAGFGPGFDFAAVDANGDGKVTQDEVKAYRAARIAGIDADGDNLISAEELAAMMTAHMQERVDKMAAARIEAQDVNGDGKLSVEEMLAPPMNGRMFSRIDTDGDGAVSEAEIAAAREKMGERGGRGMRGHGKGDHRMGDHDQKGGHGWFGRGGDDN
jgi:Ca2+-binding EF-hand superfamily protein